MTTSFWMAGCVPKSAEIVIIGGGLSGVSLAYWISEVQGHANNVLLLEGRDQIAEGATGRNGGHLLAHPDNPFEWDVVEMVKDTCRKLKIDCGLCVNGTVDLLRPGAEVERKYVEMAKELPEKFTWLNADEVSQTLGFKKGIFAGGLLAKDAARVSASQFIKRLSGVVLARGATIRTRAYVRRIHRGVNGAPHRIDVSLDRAMQPGVNDAQSSAEVTVQARVVVNACNALASRLPIVPPTRLPAHFIVPTRGQVVHAVSKDAKRIPHNFIVDESMTAYAASLVSPALGDDWSTAAPTAPGNTAELIIGGCRLHASGNCVRDLCCALSGHELGVADDSVINPVVSAALKKSLTEWTGAHWEFQQEWTGIMGFTTDEQPVVGELEERLYIMAGFNGHGGPTCFGAAKHVADLIFGKKSAHKVPNKWLPSADRLKNTPSLLSRL